jgi:signal transduction histidine kinase/sugar lactone lactonase YvrE
VQSKWNTDNGFVGRNIYAISESADGYLWIGTDRGLVRFDGYSFELIQHPLSDSSLIGRVRGLVLDDEGTLWIRPEGGPMLLYRDGHFENAFEHFEVPDSTITAMALDRSGRVLVSGLWNASLRYENGKLRQIDGAKDAPGPVLSMAESKDGRLWIGTRNDGLFVLDHGSISKSLGGVGETKINALVPVENGGVWIGTDHGIQFLTEAGVALNNLPSWTHQKQVLAMLRDHDGNIWAGTHDGLLRIAPDGNVTFQESKELEGSEVGAVFEDHEGNLWYGGPAGLERMQDGIFTTFSAREGVPTAPMGPVYADADGAIWFAPLSGSLYRMKSGRVVQVRAEGLDHDIVYSIDGGGGEIWIGRQHGGLTRITQIGNRLVTKTFTKSDGLAQNSVYVVHKSRDSAVWAGTVNGGVFVLKGSTFKSYSSINGLSSNSVNSITESSDGAIWVGTSAGLNEFQKGRWIQWTTKDGLGSADVRSCYADSKGVLWIVTATGLSYLSGGHISTSVPLPNPLKERILGITEDKVGFLWFSTSNDVFRLNRQSLLSGSLNASDVQIFGVSDGLSGFAEMHRDQTLISDPTGRIWISTSHGIASADARIADRDSLPIRVRMDSLAAGAESLSLTNPPKLNAGTRSVTFHFRSDSFFAPERVRFRYKLDGVDQDWSDAGDLRQVTYNNLGPGSHRFRVKASRDGRLWNSAETTATFSIERAYWETWWFRIVEGLAGLAIVMFLIRLRSKRLSQQLNSRFQERLAERNRLAGELHDTILQTVQATKMIADNARLSHPNDPGHLLEAVDKVSDWLGRATTEARAALHELRDYSSPRNDLAEAFERAARASNLGTEMRFVLSVQGVPQELDPIVRDEIYRIGSEAIRNAYLHSVATELNVSLSYSQSLTVRVSDNGKGIDPNYATTGKPGHFGLAGMKERARRIRGILHVRSRPGSGTEVELIVPGRVVYPRADSGQHSWYAPFKTRFQRRVKPATQVVDHAEMGKQQ